MDFNKYKDRLKEYLCIKGIEITKGGMFRCLFHSSGKEKTPSCKIYNNIQKGITFHCFGCGKTGDIYDAVEILEGITDRKQQFDFVENLFSGTEVNHG